MKKLTFLTLPFIIALASFNAMAEDGSDHALSSVPSARAPLHIQSDRDTPKTEDVKGNEAEEDGKVRSKDDQK
jgi:hypothetical protein